MSTDQMTPYEIVETYRDDILILLRYLPWLEERSGKKVAVSYNQNDIGANSISFPVYDGTLLQFVREARATSFMNINYRYGLLRYRLKESKDEIAFIPTATIQQMNILGDILSKYVLGGQTKGRLWSQAMDEGIFLDVVAKMKELLDFWTATNN